MTSEAAGSQPAQLRRPRDCPASIAKSGTCLQIVHGWGANCDIAEGECIEGGILPRSEREPETATAADNLDQAGSD